MAERTQTGARPAPGARLWSGLVSRVAGISEREASVSVRGFRVERAEAVERIETIGRTFVRAYNAALAVADPIELTPVLAEPALELAGFGYEGAAMGLAVADGMTPLRRPLFDAYIDGIARSHAYIAWVGFGWALARLPIAPLRVVRKRSGLNRWLALDGWGFHDGYFHWRRAIVRRQRPRSLSAEAARVYDQGLGRSLWFVRGAQTSAMAATVGAFEAARHGDLWAGVGLAAAYAGIVDAQDWQALRQQSGPHAVRLAQGVVFAAEARRRAGNPAAHTDLACRALLALTAEQAADVAIESLPAGDDLAAYQGWRLEIMRRCSHVALQQEEPCRFSVPA